MSHTEAQPDIPVLDLTPQIDDQWDELRDAFENVVRSGQFIGGPEVDAFEREAAVFLGVEHAIGVNSGTDALVIGLRALGIGSSDEVITTPFTFFATAESISAVGATPVFADVDEATFNIDPARVAERITDRTRAIMPVHLYGNPCAMDEILTLAHRHDLKVIEDCAQSFGARHGAVRTGAIGDVGAFSFFPSKNLGAFGDGGLIATDDDHIADMCRMLRAHGAKKKYYNELLGYNSRLDSVQAALLRVRLPRVDAWNAQRREVAQRYNELLADVPHVHTPIVTDGHVFHQYTIRIDGHDRDRVQAELGRRGIGTMVYYPVPQDRLPIYAGQYPPNPASDRLSEQVLSLPIWPSLPRDTQQRIVGELASILR